MRLKHEIIQLLQELNLEETEIISKRFGFSSKKQSLELIAKKFKVSKQAIHIKEKKALSKLRMENPGENLKNLLEKIKFETNKNKILIEKDYLSNLAKIYSLQQATLSFIITVFEPVRIFNANKRTYESFLFDEICVAELLKKCENLYSVLKIGAKVNKLEIEEKWRNLIPKIHKKIILNGDYFKINSTKNCLKKSRSYPFLKEKIFEFLKEKGTPQHYLEIYKEISPHVISPPHKRSVLNVLTNSENFVQCGKGKYALAEWNIERAKSIKKLIIEFLKNQTTATRKDIYEFILQKRPDIKSNTICGILTKTDLFKEIKCNVFTLNNLEK